jgi:oxalate decarboxylase/phosphoglucose isomerase-like protein (cupin superfamily)
MTTLSRRTFVMAGGAAALAVPATTLAAPGNQPATPVVPKAQDTPDPYFFSLANAAPSTIPGGIVRRCTKAVFPILQGVARLPHMHTNANELSYIASGKARAGIIGPNGQKDVFDLDAGDLVFFPQGYMHWLANIADGPMVALFMYSNEQPVTIDLSDINARVPQGGAY